MSNKVIFGLEQVHLAFLGTAQVESIQILTGCTLDGEITVTITGAPLTGGTEAIVVPLSTESHGTAAKVASAIANTLGLNSDFAENYVAYVVGDVVYIKARIVASNDATLDIAIAAGATGVTNGASTAVTAGATGWGTPTAIPGAVRFAPTPEGEESKFFADNSEYYSVNNNLGYSAELEMALVPDSILATMLGWDLDANGMIVEVSDGVPTPFALMAQVQGDSKNRRFVYYKCTANRPTTEHRTKGETLEPDTEKLSLTISPIAVTVGAGTKNVVKGVMELTDANAAAYAAFFDAVTTPAA